MEEVSLEEASTLAASLISGIRNSWLSGQDSSSQRNVEYATSLQKSYSSDFSHYNRLQTIESTSRCNALEKMKLLSSSISNVGEFTIQRPFDDQFSVNSATGKNNVIREDYFNDTNNFLQNTMVHDASCKQRDQTYVKKCPQCSEINGKDANWCMECGKAILSVEIRRSESVEKYTNKFDHCSFNASRSAPLGVKQSHFPQFTEFQARYCRKSNIWFNSSSEINTTDDSYAKEDLEPYKKHSLSFDFQNPQFDNEEQCFSNDYSCVEDLNNAVYRKTLTQTGCKDPMAQYYAFDDLLYPNQAIYDPMLGSVIPSSNVVSNGLVFNAQIQFDANLMKKDKVASRSGKQLHPHLNGNDQLSRTKKYKHRKALRKQNLRKNSSSQDAEGFHQLHKPEDCSFVPVPDEILLFIFQKLPIQTVAKCARVSKQFYRVASDESLWKEINITKKNNLTDNELVKIAKKQPSILRITQCNGKRITEDGLRHLFRTCADSLQVLDISGCSGGVLNAESVLLHVSSRCKSIHSLDISWSNISNIGVQSICESSKSLEQFSLNGCQGITDDSVIAIAEKHYPTLQVLEVFGCFNLTPASINRVAQLCRNIKKLNLGQCHKITKATFSNIAKHLVNLESLDIRGCKQIKDSTLKDIVAHCTSLTTLVIANCPDITDSTLFTIATLLPNLRSLDACGCNKITDKGVCSLAKRCTKLTILDLSSTKVTSRSVSAIAHHCNEALLSLKLSFCHSITDACLHTVVCKCKRLQTLHLYGCKPLRHLYKLVEINPKLKIERESLRS